MELWFWKGAEAPVSDPRRRDRGSVFGLSRGNSGGPAARRRPRVFPLYSKNPPPSQPRVKPSPSRGYPLDGL